MQAERYRRGEANLLSGLALASNASWWDTEQPTAAWAKRYGGDFEQTAKYLADSRQAEEASRAAEARELRQKSRNRLVTVAVVLVLCIITPLSVFAGYSAWRADKLAAAAEVDRAAAEADRQKAIDAAKAEAAARQEADRQREEADRQREAAEAAVVREQKAAQEAAAAQAQVLALERQRREEEQQRAAQARVEFQHSNLDQLAERVSTLQRSGSWDTASNLLGALWNGLIGPKPDLQKTWLVDPIVKAFARQNLARISGHLRNSSPIAATPAGPEPPAASGSMLSIGKREQATPLRAATRSSGFTTR